MSDIPILEVLKYINQVRKDPRGFIKYIDEDIDSFIDQFRMPLGSGLNYQVNEGKKAWIQCKNFLQKQKPLQPYHLSKALNQVAEDHATDLSINRLSGHTGSDGSSFSSRIQRRCGTKGYGTWSESIGSDFIIQKRNNPLKTIIGLLVDDGLASRCHRQSILSDQFKFIGLCSKKQQDKIITVINYHSMDLKMTNFQPLSKILGFKNPQKIQKDDEPEQKQINKKQPQTETPQKLSSSSFSPSPSPKETEKKVKSKQTTTTTLTQNDGRKIITTITKTVFTDGRKEEVVDVLEQFS